VNSRSLLVSYDNLHFVELCGCVADDLRSVWPRPMSSYGDSYAYKDIIVARSDILV